MSRRRGWDALSAAYRRRLERGGIGRDEYESGASLKAARGHKTTPESMMEYSRHPNRFKEYRERRKDLVSRVVEKKRLAFEAALRWNEGHSEQYARRGGRDIKPPTLAQLRQIDAMTVDELVDFQYQVHDQDDWRFLWYH